MSVFYEIINSIDSREMVKIYFMVEFQYLVEMAKEN